MEIKCIVAGGRDFNNYPLLCMKLNVLFSKKVEDGSSISIVSGLARGADSLGEKYARENGYECLEYPADWDKYGKSAGYKRNTQMAAIATHAVIFWDGQSKGTKHMIDLCIERKVSHRVIKY